MASETFVSAMMLITGVVAASILIVAVLPVIWGMVGTFGSASAATDRSMRTDFKIVTTFAAYCATSGSYLAGANVSVWMKNTGTARIGKGEIRLADVYVGRTDNFKRNSVFPGTPPVDWPFQRATTANNMANYWFFYIYEPQATSGNDLWDPGETLQIDTFAAQVSNKGQGVYFQLTLPSGVSRSTEFTSS